MHHLTGGSHRDAHNWPPTNAFHFGNQMIVRLFT